MEILAWEPSAGLILLAFALGIVFAVAEVFLPSGGALTILSVVSFVAAIVLGFMLGQTVGVLTLVGVIVLAPALLYFSIRIWPHTPFAKKLILTGPSSTGRAGDLAGHDPRELVGKVGVAKTALRPAGKVVFGDRQIDCVTEGDLVPRGAKVEVIEVHGARVVVRAVEEEGQA